MLLVDNIPDMLDAPAKKLGPLGDTVEDYQKIAVSMLRELDRLCGKHDLRYFLAYGTLIGAVRHQGFIPWDDDVDVMMPRKDFEKFKAACETELDPGFELSHYTNESGYSYTYPRLRKRGTTCILVSEISRFGRHAGMYIDIIPFDYLSENPVVGAIQLKSLYFLHRVICPEFSQRFGTYLSWPADIFIRCATLVFGRRRIASLLERILSCAKGDNSSVILNCFIQSPDSRLPKEHFEKSFRAGFEGITASLPDRPITLLSRIYSASLAQYGISFDNQFEDENAAVQTRLLYRYLPILYKPQALNLRHACVVVDTKRDSAHYTDRYFRAFERAENDRCARREARLREREVWFSNAFLDAANEGVQQCNMAIIQYCLAENEKRIEAAIAAGDANALAEIGETLWFYQIHLTPGLPEDVLLRCAMLYARMGDLFTAKILLLRVRFLYPEGGGEERDRISGIVDAMLDAELALFEGRDAAVLQALKHYGDEKEWYASVAVFKGYLLYRRRELSEAKSAFEKILQWDKTAFWCHYFLGCIHRDLGKTREALAAFTEACDKTTFVPYLSSCLAEMRKLIPGGGKPTAYDRLRKYAGISGECSDGG